MNGALESYSRRLEADNSESVNPIDKVDTLWERRQVWLQLWKISVGKYQFLSKVCGWERHWKKTFLRVFKSLTIQKWHIIGKKFKYNSNSHDLCLYSKVWMVFLAECMPEQEMFENVEDLRLCWPRPIHSLWDTTWKISVMEDWIIAYRVRLNCTFWYIICLCVLNDVGRVSNRKMGSQYTMGCKINTRQFPAGKSREWAVRFAPWRKNYES